MGKVLDRPATRLPPLRDGERMRREEFHRRYEAMGPLARAELIEGWVYVYRYGDGRVASAVSLDKHGTPHLDLCVWVGYYCARTPGLVRGSDSTVFVDDLNEPQPDVLLGIPASAGGQTRTVVRNGKVWVDGTPELLVEVSATTAKVDLGPKLRAYERNGVAEYVVALTTGTRPRLRWMARAGDRLADLDPDPADGLLKSRRFPGLWLDAAALLRGDPVGVIAAVEAGCATPEHAAFARRVAPSGGD